MREPSLVPGEQGPSDSPSGDPSGGRPVVASAAADIRLLIPALTAWAVVAAALATPVQWLLAASAALILGVSGGWLVSRRRQRRDGIRDRCDVASRPKSAGPVGAWAGLLALTGVATALALVCLAIHSAVREAGPVSELAAERATVTVEATVASEPRLVPPRAGRPAAEPLVVTRIQVDSVTARGAQSAVQSPVLVLGDASWLAVRWQERVRIAGRLSPPTDPGGDVLAVLNPRAPPTSLEPPGPVQRLADVVRARFRLATDDLPGDARGLLPGLVIGDTTNTPSDLTDAMLVTGMTHLSAVSGSNVAIILVAGVGLCRLVGLRRRWRPVAALAILAGFVVLVRPEPSVIRAAAMGAVGLLGMSTSRRRAGIPALAAAILALLCWDPWLARSFGFALSSLATLGLLLFASPWGAVIARVLPLRIKHWGPTLAIPFAAQLMCAPVIVLLQGSVTLIGIVANLLAAPLVAPATILGAATALLSVVWTGGATLLGRLAALPTLGIAWVARACSEVPMGSVPWPQGAPGAVLLTVLSLAAVLSGPWLLHHSRRRPVAFVAIILVGVASALPTRLVTWPLPQWQLVACDVGQGDGLVLRTGPVSAVVVDVGPDPDAIDGCLSRLGVRVIDAVVLTHFHADHVDGLSGALHGREVRQILATPVHDPPSQWEKVHQWAGEARVPIAELYAGDDLSLDGISAHVWWPARVIREGSVPNNASIVMTVDVAGLRVAMLGDVEREAGHQVLLAMRREGLTLAQGFDVVKVAHHGSANRDDDLLSALHAPMAVISVGVDNDYGHPAPSTLGALQADGFTVSRTDEDGDIAYTKAPDGTVVVAARH